MIALALVSWALAADTDLTTLGAQLETVQARVHLPIVVGTPDALMVSRLNALDNDLEDLSIVVVSIDPNKDTALQMKRALSRRAMRCGVFVEEKAGVWNTTEFGRCGTPSEKAPAASPAAPPVAPATPSAAPQLSTDGVRSGGVTPTTPG